MTDEDHPPPSELPERRDWGSPGAEVPGDPDEEARLEAALLAEIQRTMLDPDEQGARPAPGGRGDLVPGEAVPPPPGPGEGKNVRLTAWLRGRVQGVGFRWWARSRALELGLTGWAENLTDGRVKVVAEGPREACAQLLELLDGRDTPGHVEHVTHRWDAARGGLASFAER